jgi:integrase/recombinase XerD
MPYQYVREPLTADEADRLANACDTPTEKLVVWTLLDTGLRVGELCDLTSRSVLSRQRQLRFKDKGSPYGKRTKTRVVPMSSRVRALREHHFALEKSFPVRKRRAQDIVKAVADRAGIRKDVSPHVLRHNADSRIMPTGVRRVIRVPANRAGPSRPEAAESEARQTCFTGNLLCNAALDSVILEFCPGRRLTTRGSTRPGRAGLTTSTVTGPPRGRSASGPHRPRGRRASDQGNQEDRTQRLGDGTRRNADREPLGRKSGSERRARHRHAGRVTG